MSCLAFALGKTGTGGRPPWGGVAACADPLRSVGGVLETLWGRCVSDSGWGVVRSGYELPRGVALCAVSLPVLEAPAIGMGAVLSPLRLVAASRWGGGGAFLEGSLCLRIDPGEGGFVGRVEGWGGGGARVIFTYDSPVDFTLASSCCFFINIILSFTDKVDTSAMLTRAQTSCNENGEQKNKQFTMKPASALEY